MRNEKKANVFVIVLFLLIAVCVLLFPKIYSYLEKLNLPEIEKIDTKNEEVTKVVDEEILESIHFPIMRNSIYESNTYYSLDKFTTKDMSNNDILYNAFMDIYEGNITNSSVFGKCNTLAKEFNKDYIELRIKNILGKNVYYVLDDFYVPEDSNSNYPGTWTYDSLNSRYIYNGLCESRNSGIKYYNLEQYIKAEYEDSDVVVYYYVGFAKVQGSNYVIYKDANMINELQSGTFIDLEMLNSVFDGINNKDKNVYKYTFKDTLCSYNEYCLYEGKWVNEL